MSNGSSFHDPKVPGMRRDFNERRRCFPVCLFGARRSCCWLTALVGWLVLLAQFSIAKPVPESLAELVGRNWLTERSRSVKGGGSLAASAVSRNGPVVAYYIFNYEPSGCAIIAGDDVAYPVIYYSEEGRYTLDRVPPQLEALLQDARDEILEAVEAQTAPVEQSAEAWKLYGSDRFKPDKSRATEAVAPMLTTTWDQGRYYNALCPADPDGPGGRTWAGCVAVAMGQIMRYHGHPARGQGSWSYECYPYGELWAEFNQTWYNWSAMPNALTSDNYEVARLLYHAGVAAEMDYGPDGSAASPLDAWSALILHFGYDTSAWFSPREMAPSSEVWLTALKENLDARLPVYYGGFSPSGGGHAFVVDGYEGADHFHMNFGWSGYGNGYFYLNDLTPYDHDYSYDQSAIFDIRPALPHPDLQPCTPPNWNHPITVSTATYDGEAPCSCDGPYYDDQTLYLNVSLANIGGSTAPASPWLLGLDQSTVIDLDLWPDLEPDAYYYMMISIVLPPLPAGQHTFDLIVDPFDQIYEGAGEENNIYSRTIQVLSRSALGQVADVIRHFYDEILGRTPSQGEVDAWHYGYFDWMVAQNVDVRFVPSEMGRQFFLSQEYQNRATSDSQFITDCYNAFLYRDPSAEEITGWTPVANRKEAMSIFANSAEFQNRVAALFPGFTGDATRNFVATMYLGLLDRLPDPGGLAAYTDVFISAADKRARAKQMGLEVSGSQEYAEKRATNALRVESLYRAYLGRYPNNGETQYWGDELAAGRQTLASMIEAFGNSQEFSNRLEQYFGGAISSQYSDDTRVHGSVETETTDHVG